MSNDAITWAFKQSDLKSGPKFVLVVLADFADDEWSCFPGVAKIAARTGTSVSAARENIRRLEAAGCIVTKAHPRPNGSQSSNRYTLVSTRAPESGGSPETGGGTPQIPVGDPPESGGAKKNPQMNPQTEPPLSSSTELVAMPQGPTPDDAFERAWKVWPRKQDKKLARERFMRLVKGRAMAAEDLATAIARHGTVYAGWPASEQEFVPYLSKWLLRERWNDPEPMPRRGSTDRNVVEQARRVYERLLAEEAAKREAESRGIA